MNHTFKPAPGLSIAEATIGLKGLLASVNRVLAKAEGANRAYLLGLVSEFQKKLLAIDARGMGRELHVLPLLPEKIENERIVEMLEQSSQQVRENFSRTCIGLDHLWSGALYDLPYKISIHALG